MYNFTYPKKLYNLIEYKQNIIKSLIKGYNFPFLIKTKVKLLFYKLYREALYTPYIFCKVNL
ncbi:hypothetical protein EHRUM4_09090 [Ehrlichia ruminantium]|uniref:Uncharacterized protein n=1 Tax=Ehrlichia ruminantium TaxID=779 RepID=A0A161MLY1_EHRRU|nr:hypothetical protein EHRUM4_09090 [Ehrlichia ruminantium]GAT77651.1 hypothetical protein EHRUM2_08800 [Ehrlichia ruminantium]GAT78821.1 hypothetical protein EHRUM3_10530 [Ehrlichia ruminantium]